MLPTREKPQRVLACLSCQHRKIKCDRNFPCSNCTKAGSQCIPVAASGRPRKKRFPEKELLEKLRKYEEIMRKNGIDFASQVDEARGVDVKINVAEEGSVSADGENGVGGVYDAKDFWRAMSQRPQDSAESDDDNDEDEHDQDGNPTRPTVVREETIREIFNTFPEYNTHLAFTLSRTNITLMEMHPKQIDIFRLWQVYLDNVNPLLKVTHTPTLQARILDAAGNMGGINPELEALMFGIYCVAAFSLTEEECIGMFAQKKADLLRQYQIGCQCALQNCGFLRSKERDCLTALFFYLCTFRVAENFWSLGTLLALATRTAERMCLHNEASNAKHSIFEAEMRRRLWWSLVLFDSQICSKSQTMTTTLTPIWDCKMPLNINDSDLREDMKSPPTAYGGPTEALFAVVRYQIAQVIRHSASHLDFTYPALKSLGRQIQNASIPPGGDFILLEKLIHAKYLKHCNAENPLHVISVCIGRAMLAKSRLTEHYCNFSSASSMTDSQRDKGLCHAMDMLRCDTKLLTSATIKRFSWFVDFYFPFPAYLHVIQDVRKRPKGKLAPQAWRVFDENYLSRGVRLTTKYNPFYQLFSSPVLAAWGAMEAAGVNMAVPEMVADVKATKAQEQQEFTDVGGGAGAMINFDDFNMPMPAEFSTPDMMIGGGEELFAGIATSAFSDFGSDQFDWSIIDWEQGVDRGW